MATSPPTPSPTTNQCYTQEVVTKDLFSAGSGLKMDLADADRADGAPALSVVPPAREEEDEV